MHYSHPPYVHVARMGEGRDARMDLVGKPEGKRTLEKPRCRWDDSIKIYLKEIVWSGCYKHNSESAVSVKCW